MKNALRISLLLIALLFLLAWRFAPARQASDEPEPSGEVRRPDAAVPDHTRTLRVLHGGAVEEMTMDEYLLGVLRAEMPASFELEALKAQAVAARTYTLHKMAQGAIARHPDADACDDITCCKAYETAEDAAAGWGAGALYYEEKLARAVAETDGEVIVYDGEPVLAVFFSSAAGHTQGAGEVWQTDLPYLQSVDSPEDDSLVPNYYSVVTFTAQEFRDRFLAALPCGKAQRGRGQLPHGHHAQRRGLRLHAACRRRDGARQRAAHHPRPALAVLHGRGQRRHADLPRHRLRSRRRHEPVRRERDGEGGLFLRGDLRALLYRRAGRTVGGIRDCKGRADLLYYNIEDY